MILNVAVCQQCVVLVDLSGILFVLFRTHFAILYNVVLVTKQLKNQITVAIGTNIDTNNQIIKKAFNMLT
jgi:hypothetical protein